MKEKAHGNTKKGNMVEALQSILEREHIDKLS